MRRIDELHMDWPFAGARMLARILKREGQPVGRRRVATLMKRMGIHALYRKPNTSKRHPAHKVYPYRFCRINFHKASLGEFSHFPFMQDAFVLPRHKIVLQKTSRHFLPSSSDLCGSCA